MHLSSGVRPNKVPASDGEDAVIIELWGMRSAPSSLQRGKTQQGSAYDVKLHLMVRMQWWLSFEECRVPLHLCSGVRPNKVPAYDVKLHLMVRMQWWLSFEECGVPLHLCSGVRPNKVPAYDVKLHLMVRMQWWLSFEECGVPLHLCSGVRPNKVLHMMLNCIWWWGCSDDWALRNAECPFISAAG